MNQTAEWFRQAQSFHEAGLHDKAEPLYRAILKAQPDHEEAAFWLASLYTNQGRHADAIPLYYRAIDLNPDAPENHTGLGLALQAFGQPDEAAECFLQALALKPGIPELHYYLGSARFAQDRTAEAEAEFRRAAALKPDFLEANINLRETLQKQGRLEEAADVQRTIEKLHGEKNKPTAAKNSGHWKGASARKTVQTRTPTAQSHAKNGSDQLIAGKPEQAAASFRTALKADPKDALAHNGLGTALAAMGRHDEAFPHFETAVNLQPMFADALGNLGTVYAMRDDLREAESLFRRASALSPKSANWLANLATTLSLQQRFEEAEPHSRAAIALNPTAVHSRTYLNLILLAMDRFEEAQELCRQTLALFPDAPDSYMSLALTHEYTGDFAAAESVYRQILEIDPDFAGAHTNIGLIRLQNGDFAAGWRGYQRLAAPGGAGHFQLLPPPWDGTTLPDQTLFIHADQGLGDGIQFSRYIPLAAQRVGKIVLECYPELVSLFAPFLPYAEIVPKMTESQKADAGYTTHISITQLAAVFWEEAGAMGDAIPYLRVEAEKAAAWRERWQDEKRFKVGIVWAGGDKYTKDRMRSTVLATFAPLAAVPNVHLFSLQKGSKAGQIAAPPDGMEITDLADDLHDYTETAAAIANLDLVITVDTSVAHLAGAIGKPVWNLLPYYCDWRWLTEGETTHWYPAMRLFRQPAPGDWAGLLAHVTEALREKASGIR